MGLGWSTSNENQMEWMLSYNSYQKLLKETWLSFTQNQGWFFFLIYFWMIIIILHGGDPLVKSHALIFLSKFTAGTCHRSLIKLIISKASKGYHQTILLNGFQSMVWLWTQFAISTTIFSISLDVFILGARTTWGKKDIKSIMVHCAARWVIAGFAACCNPLFLSTAARKAQIEAMVALLVLVLA